MRKSRKHFLIAMIFDLLAIGSGGMMLYLLINMTKTATVTPGRIGLIGLFLFLMIVFVLISEQKHSDSLFYTMCEIGEFEKEVEKEIERKKNGEEK